MHKQTQTNHKDCCLHDFASACIFQLFQAGGDNARFLSSGTTEESLSTLIPTAVIQLKNLFPDPSCSNHLRQDQPSDLRVPQRLSTLTQPQASRPRCTSLFPHTLDPQQGSSEGSAADGFARKEMDLGLPATPSQSFQISKRVVRGDPRTSYTSDLRD